MVRWNTTRAICRTVRYTRYLPLRFEAGIISVFLDGLLDNNNNNKRTRAAAKPVIEKNPSYSSYPEENLSDEILLCGTPPDHEQKIQQQQVKALAQEILYLQVQAQNLEMFGSSEYCNATVLQIGLPPPTGFSYYGAEAVYYYDDGRGNYFKISTLAKASAMQITANSKMHEALRLKLLAEEKEFYLLQLKSMLYYTVSK